MHEAIDMASLIERYVAIACQYRQHEILRTERTRRAVALNLERLEAFVGWAYEQYSYGFPVKLIAFPETCINGDTYVNIDEGLSMAEAIPGESTDRLGELCKKFGVYLVAGMAEVHPDFPETVFNSTPLISPEGKVLITYRKVNPWLPDEFWPSPGDFLSAGWKDEMFPVAKTDIGNIGIYVCNDGTTPETARQLAFNGAEVLVHPTMLMDPWVVPPLDIYDVQCRWHSFSNICYGVNANAAFEPDNSPPYAFHGGSNICDYQGRILAACPKAAVESFCFEPLDIGMLRAYRTTMPTHNGLASFRGVYNYWNRPCTYPPNSQIKEDWDVRKSREYVRDAHKRFWRDYYKDSVK